MAKFDFIEASGKGYAFTWKHRQEILYLSILPFFVKMAVFSAIIFLGLENNFLRQGLFQLPAYFLEAFLVVQVLRMALYNEKGAGLFDNGTQLHQFSPEQRRAIMSGVVIYLLTKLIASFLSSWMMIAEKVEPVASTAMPEAQGPTFITGVMILIFMLWAFRFFWLYIPAAMGISIAAFLDKIKAFTTSVYMAGLWVLCFIPVAVMLIMASKILITIFPGADGQQSIIYTFSIAALQAFTELAIAVISTVAMGYAFQSILQGKNKPPGLF